MKFAIVLALSLALTIDCKTIEVSSASELDSALKSVSGGDTIHLHDGKYHGTFESSKSGSDGSPITLTGSKSAVLSGSNYGFWLKGSHWVLKGFSVSGAKKGIVLEGASHCVLDGLDVGNTEEEGIHFRTSSADNILQNSKVHNTGTGTPGFGEGVYIGQAFHNWAGGKQDKSDRNQIINNHIGPNVAAECIDIKEGSCCGTIKGNTFDGTGEKGEHDADSWVDVKGDKYTIEDNTGTHSIKDGFQIHHIAESGMGGCNNVIENNHCNGLGSGGKCVVDASKGCSNTIKNN